MDEMPANHLTTFILDLLSPLLTTGANPDPCQARDAVAQTIAAYDPRDPLELVNAAQIFGFAVTALDDLRLSAAADLSLPLKLKLRSNANALNRAAHLGSKALCNRRRTKPCIAPGIPEQPANVTPDEPPPSAEAGPASPVAEPRAAVPVPNRPVAPQASTEQANRMHWAQAMRTHAAELRAGDARRSSSERKTSSLWADVLTSVANELTAAQTATPHLRKSNLLRTTLMTRGAGFPPDYLTALCHRDAPRKPARR
jgi:hypothetical protein